MEKLLFNDYNIWEMEELLIRIKDKTQFQWKRSTYPRKNQQLEDTFKYKEINLDYTKISMSISHFIFFTLVL